MKVHFSPRVADFVRTRVSKSRGSSDLFGFFRASVGLQLQSRVCVGEASPSVVRPRTFHVTPRLGTSYPRQKEREKERERERERERGEEKGRKGERQKGRARWTNLCDSWLTRKSCGEMWSGLDHGRSVGPDGWSRRRRDHLFKHERRWCGHVGRLYRHFRGSWIGSRSGKTNWTSTELTENETLKIGKDEIELSNSITFSSGVWRCSTELAKRQQRSRWAREDESLQDCDPILADMFGGNVALDESSSVEAEVLGSTHSCQGEGDQMSALG